MEILPFDLMEMALCLGASPELGKCKKCGSREHLLSGLLRDHVKEMVEELTAADFKKLDVESKEDTAIKLRFFVIGLRFLLP